MLEKVRDTLQKTRTKFLWFSGKGGTGKTTISTATALQLAGRGHEVLLISTDPAHSVSDSLDVEIEDTGDPVRVEDNLDVLELDPEEEVEAYRQQMQMADMQDQMGLMNEVQESMDIMKGGPGVAEMAAFNKFMTYMQSDDYDVIVFDTAPTGHTLTLLELPEVMDSMVGKVLKMRMRFSQAIDTFKTMMGGEANSESDIEKLETMKQRIEDAREMLADPEITSFNFVMLPEKMSVYETERALDRVQDFDIPIGRIFVNQLLPENPDCDFCTSRRAMQQENLELIHERFPGHTIVEIPLFDTEVRGTEMLAELADRMTIHAPADADDDAFAP